MVGVGFGPFTSKLGIFLAWLISKMLDYITVRDSASFQFLQDIKMPMGRMNLTFDLACLLELENTQLVKDSPILGISALPYFFGYSREPEKDNEMASNFVRAINQWLAVAPNREVRLLTFLGREEGDGDAFVIQRIWQQLDDKSRAKIVMYSSDPRKLLSAVQDCTAVLTMRYHAAVYAYLVQRPMVIIDYHPKCRTFANDIHYRGTLLSIDDLMNDKLLSVIEYLFQEPDLLYGDLDICEAKRRVENALPPELRRT
jgi:polysaccharide pyruvyl transferase WcaK-like protein